MPRSVTVEWEGRRVEAADPDPIAGIAINLGPATIRRTERAGAAVRHSGHLATGAAEVAARLLLRSEGLASSAIEGLRATPHEVALAEAGGGDPDSIPSWVADNLAVVHEALNGRRAVDGGQLFAWHRRLMRNSPTIAPEHVGAYRDRLGWVGGPNPLVAAHVAVPPERIGPLMGDLFAFMAADDLDAVTQAAVAHAQFETIHPFADGNGRLGRVLIGRMLSHRLDVAVPPPLSLVLARDVGGYQAGLTLYRLGDVEAWVSWFADAVREAAERSVSVLEAALALEGRWRSAIRDLRADATAHRVIGLLAAHPVVSAASVGDLLGVSNQAALTALTQLADRSVLEEAPTLLGRRGRPRRWWVASELLGLVGR